MQILADSHGVTWAAGIRDCTLQRHNQKVVEESASTALTPEQEVAVLAAARRVAQQARYRGAGTVEFLYRPADGILWFLEVNPRLQVEHPVTEATTGLDLVKAQLHIAEGGRLEGHPPARVGHAIEVRIYAEDPEHDFAPSPGAIALLRLPTGPGVRVDTGVVEGDDIPSEFDAMIAKLTSWGRDRGEALVRLRRALAETAVVIEGGATNRGFLLDLLDREEFRSGDFDNTWLDQLAASGGTTSDRFAHVALNCRRHRRLRQPAGRPASKLLRLGPPGPAPGRHRGVPPSRSPASCERVLPGRFTGRADPLPGAGGPWRR